MLLLARTVSTLQKIEDLEQNAIPERGSWYRILDIHVTLRLQTEVRSPIRMSLKHQRLGILVNEDMG